MTRSLPWLAAAMLLACSAPSRDKPPNVVMIISDDQAFTDFGFMGHPTIETPNLDRLAEQSVRFSNGYVPSSVCRPSLATLLTGLFPHQHGIHFNDPPDKSKRQEAEYLIRAVPTLPRLLAGAGYRSLQTGKFWEGPYRNAGFTHGMSHGDPTRRYEHPELGLLRGRSGDLGLKIGRDGMQPIFDFIAASGVNPFLVWYAPLLPHEPHNPPARYTKRYEGRGLHSRLVRYYAMCTWFDDTAGELLRFLDEHELSDDTLVVFLSDNGWVNDLTRPRGFARRSKRSPFEMGVRTPILMRWPGRIEPADHDDLVSSVDLVPTLLDAAGLASEAAGLPGSSLLPLATRKGTLDRNAVYGETFTHDASRLGDPAADLLYRWIRVGEWKLIDAQDPRTADMLYRIADAGAETVNLIDDPQQIERVTELRRQLDEWWNPERRERR
jgi:uncharacterized sulfatase